MISNTSFWDKPEPSCIDSCLSSSPRSGLSVGGRYISVFAVDPGETTGWIWALVSPADLAAYGVSPRLFQHLHSTQRLIYGQVSTWDYALIGSGEDGSRSLYHGEEGMTRHLASLVRSAGQKTGRIVSTVLVGKPAFITHVVAEDFVLRAGTKTRNLLSPVRVTTGLFNELHRMDESLLWYFQSPSDKAIVTDDRLRSLGLWFVGEEHARDAARHLVLFLKRYSS